MSQQGPRNGYTWTPRELMQRRDHERWQRAHLWVTLAPVPALLCFPVGTMVGLIGFTLSWLEQLHQIRSPFTDGSEQFSRPIMIQRIFACITVAAAFTTFGQFGAAGLLGAIGGVIWFRLLGFVEKRTKLESEVDRADSEALKIEETRIRE